MSALYESRLLDSPYIEVIWRGRVERDYAPVCPADVRWNLLFAKHNKRIQVSVEGATTEFLPRNLSEGSELLVIEFKLGVFMPYLPAGNFLNGEVILPQATSKSFWLNGSVWEVPDFDNADTFVGRLVREGLLARDEVVEAVLQSNRQAFSLRSLQYRFLRATGLTQSNIRQIERARYAMSLLQQGVAIIDTVHEAGYYDQSHLTSSLKRFIGQTPAQIAALSNPE